MLQVPKLNLAINERKAGSPAASQLLPEVTRSHRMSVVFEDSVDSES